MALKFSKPKPKGAKNLDEFLNKTHLNKTNNSQRAEKLLKELEKLAEKIQKEEFQTKNFFTRDQ